MTTTGEALAASQEVTLVIEQFLNENYRFRRNVLNGKVEFAILPKETGAKLSGASDEAELIYRPLTQARVATSASNGLPPSVARWSGSSTVQT